LVAGAERLEVYWSELGEGFSVVVDVLEEIDGRIVTLVLQERPCELGDRAIGRLTTRRGQPRCWARTASRCEVGA